MNNGIKKRFVTGMMAFAMVLSQIVMPVSSAFATEGVQILDQPGTNQPVWCQDTGSGWKAVLGDESSDSKNRFALKRLPNGTAVSADLYIDTISGQVYAHDKQELKDNDLDAICNSSIISTEIVISAKAICGPNNDEVIIPTVQGVIFTESVFTNNVATVTATLISGYVWSNNTTAPRTYEIIDHDTTCAPDVLPVPAAPGVDDKCGLMNAMWLLPENTETVSWSLTPGGRLIATAAEGYVFDGVGRIKDYGTAPDSNELCPSVEPCDEISGTTIVSRKSQFADNVYQDTRSKGHYQFTPEGLKIWTEDTTSESKIAWYHTYSVALADLGIPEIDYTPAISGQTLPGLQLIVDFDNDGETDGILVGESIYGNDWWLANSAKQFVKDGAPSHTGGSGSVNHGTLNQWLTNFPDAQVEVVGYSLGSGVKADGVLRSLTFGCHKWVFKYVATECSVSDNKFDREWTYDDVAFPEAGAWGGVVPGTYNFEPTGLYINTPAKESYVDGLMDAGMTPLSDVDAMSYKAMRLTKSAGYEATLPAYILLVDTKGAGNTNDLKYFFYEPYNNNHTRASVEGTFQLWDVKDGGNAKWWMSGTGQTLRTWNFFVSQFPEAVVLAYGFNQGTSNPNTYTAVQDITFDCAVTSFTYKNEGGNGGNGGGETPTGPIIPAQPNVPVGGGKGAMIPAELPMTGANGSVVWTWVALLSAVLTYGAVYFMQPKRRFED